MHNLLLSNILVGLKLAVWIDSVLVLRSHVHQIVDVKLATLKRIQDSPLRILALC